MSNFVPKQSSSRVVKPQVIQYNSATIWTTKFSSNVNQIRVVSQLGGWGTINDTTADPTVVSSAGGIGMIITGVSTGYPAAATVAAGLTAVEYFTVNPGQIFMFSSTSTSTGAVSVTEMA